MKLAGTGFCIGLDDRERMPAPATVRSIGLTEHLTSISWHAPVLRNGYFQLVTVGMLSHRSLDFRESLQGLGYFKLYSDRCGQKQELLERTASMQLKSWTKSLTVAVNGKHDLDPKRIAVGPRGCG